MPRIEYDSGSETYFDADTGTVLISFGFFSFSWNHGVCYQSDNLTCYLSGSIILLGTPGKLVLDRLDADSNAEIYFDTDTGTNADSQIPLDVVGMTCHLL